jgi:hypothetical protein
MPYVTVGTKNGAGIEIYWEDRGSGQPVVPIDGYPLDGHSWKRQTRVLLQAGYRPRESGRFPECSMPPTPATAHNGLRDGHITW